MVWLLKRVKLPKLKLPGKRKEKIKSEVAMASLLHQTKQPKKILLEVKTITKSPGNGIAESVKSCYIHQKGSFKA